MNQAISDDRFNSFVQEPSAKSFKNLQDLIFANPQYDPDSDGLRFLNRLFDLQQFDRLMNVCWEMHSVWQLSPKFQYLFGNAALELGLLETAEAARTASKAVIQGLLSTGDGSFDWPFEITYFQDEHDIAMVLGHNVRDQNLVETNLGFCDVFTLHDGQEVWMDINNLVKKRCQKQKLTDSFSSSN